MSYGDDLLWLSIIFPNVFGQLLLWPSITMHRGPLFGSQYIQVKGMECSVAPIK